MFLEKKTSDKDIDMGLCYSILQKCVRRCLINESLYYGKLIFYDGTPNALRKRLVMYCLEDMARLDLALEIFNSEDNKLISYIQIVAKNKKSRITDWYNIVCYHSFHKKLELSKENQNEEILEGYKIMDLQLKEDYKEIRKFLGKDLSKLYTYMNKLSFVWVLKILWDRREELRYPLDRTVEPIKAKKFFKIPKYALDKHVLNGTPGLKFFFENGAVINNKIYKNEPYEIEAKKFSYIYENN